jgi:Fic-DOC domain mobile mystery protein B
MIDDMEYISGETPLEHEELEGLKFSHITARNELNHLEQANIENGLLWLDRKRNPDVLTLSFTRELHKRLFGDVWCWAGKYRLTEKNIGIDPRQIGVQLKNLLDDVQYWIDNETYKPMEAAIRFHHKLVYIHPYPNGNGRHARVMADAVLEKLCDEDAIDWEGGYDLQEMNTRRNQYIGALREADGGDYKPLFDFVGYEQQ